jgi:hypothetical protein
MANIPLFIHEPLVDKNGMLTDSWKLAFTQLFQQLQSSVSDEGGFQHPPQSAQYILQLSTNVPNGTHFYDSTNNTPVVKKNGVFVPYG